MTDGPVDYPASWRPRSAPRQLPAGPAPDVIEALLLAIDSYIAALPAAELRTLLERTRP